MSKQTITIRIPKAQKAALDALAERMDVNRSELVGEALRAYLEAQEWQIQEIKQAVKEADKGKFASNAEVKAFFEKWKNVGDA